MHPVMYHVGDLSVELEDSMFDQMLRHSMMDGLKKWNSHEHVVVVLEMLEMMHKEMTMPFDLTNCLRNICLIQPKEVKLKLEKISLIEIPFISFHLRAVP